MTFDNEHLIELFLPQLSRQTNIQEMLKNVFREIESFIQNII